MHLVIYGNVLNRNVFEDVFHDDKIIDKWDLSVSQLDVQAFFNDIYTCILLIDGNYDEMYATCLKYGIPAIRILDVGRYIVYKEIEKNLDRVFNTSWDYLSCLYYEYQKIIKLYQYDNQVIKKCKDDFIKKIALKNGNIF